MHSPNGTRNQTPRRAVATFTAVLAGSVGLATAAVADQAGTGAQQEASETRLYDVQYTDLESAQTLAWTVCAEIPPVQRDDTPCQVTVMEREGYLVVIGTERIHARLNAMLERVDQPPYTQTFHIVVVALSQTAVDERSYIEPSDAVRTALDDVQTLLPFASYWVMDAGWMTTSHEAMTTLTGPTGFHAELAFRGDPSSGKPLMIDHFELSGPQPPLIAMERGETTTMPQGYRTILGTSFNISLGETVVVGTSKLNGGDQALVVFLTAIER